MAYSKGEVWWVEFPLEEDATEYITRPAIIADVCLPDVMVIKVTKSLPRTDDDFDVKLRNYRYARLRQPSTARVSKFIVINEGQIGERIGKLDRGDYRRVFAALDKLIS